VVVPDTGVFLNHPEGENGHFDIGTIAWRSLSQARILEEVRVVVPIVVIDELELIKDNRSIAEVRREQGTVDGEHAVRLIRARAGIMASAARTDRSGWPRRHRDTARRAGSPATTSERRRTG